MPGWRVHEYLDWLYFGKVYPKIHRAIDEPWKYLGRTHRILFHDAPSAILVANEFYPDDPDAVSAAFNHIHFDELCSSDPQYKKELERMELITRKERKKELAEKRRLERELEKDPVFGPFLQFIKKMEEAEKLWHSINH